MLTEVSGLSGLPASARKPALIKKTVAAVFRLEKTKPRGAVNIVILDRKRMLALNKRYLNHSHDTDVIAFNYDDPGGPLGDVYISAFQARRQAQDLGHSVLKEALTLVAHGTLHLLGYDDATPRQKALMFKKQDAVLSRVLPRN